MILVNNKEARTINYWVLVTVVILTTPHVKYRREGRAKNDVLECKPLYLLVSYCQLQYTISKHRRL